jgi:hypothetical protein
LKKLSELARDYHRASCVCILGDITNQKDKHAAWLVNQIVDLMANLAQTIPVNILAGNHDGSTPDELFFRFLNHIPNIQFIDEPAVIGKTMWLPHTRDYVRDWHGLDFNGIKCIYTHNTFKGSLNENGLEMDGIPLGALPDLPIYSGDVHVPQRLANLTYVGAPYTINFGDKFKPRAIIVDHANKMVKSVPLDGPQKRVLRTGTDGWWKGEANKNDIVRVQVELLREEYPRWAELYERSLKACAKRGLIVNSIVPYLITTDEQGTPQPKRSAPRNDMQEFRLYCDRNKVDEATAKIGEEFL